jgi:hypothetical protein
MRDLIEMNKNEKLLKTQRGLISSQRLESRIDSSNSQSPNVLLKSMGNPNINQNFLSLNEGN